MHWNICECATVWRRRQRSKAFVKVREQEREREECQSRSEEESHKRNEASFVLLFLGLVSFVARGTRELAVWTGAGGVGLIGILELGIRHLNYRGRRTVWRPWPWAAGCHAPAAARRLFGHCTPQNGGIVVVVISQSLGRVMRACLWPLNSICSPAGASVAQHIVWTEDEAAGRRWQPL